MPFNILFSRSVYILQMDLSVISSLFKVSLILLWLELATHSKQLPRLYLCLICNASSLDEGIILSSCSSLASYTIFQDCLHTMRGLQDTRTRDELPRVATGRIF